MARPSVEQWEVRQLMLSRLESDPQSLRLAAGSNLQVENLHEMGAGLHELSGELAMYADEWDREGAIEGLKAASAQYNETDLTQDPTAPLKALLTDTARFIATADRLSPAQSARFFENFCENSRGVFFDPRAGESLRGTNYPREMIAEASKQLTVGMSEVPRRMMIEKVGAGLRDASKMSAEVNRPKSAFELAHNRSFDLERAQKADPFSHLRGRDIKIERNADSNLSPTTKLDPK